MKRSFITSLLVSGALALTLGGCSASSPTTQTKTSEAQASSSVAETETTTSQNTAAETSSVQEDVSSSSEATSTAAEEAPTASSSSGNAGEGVQPNTAEGASRPMDGGPGMGGNMGGMDTQPGQTTDKGYTATDSGIAISATLKVADAFTDRDLAQTADTSSATKLTVADGKDITITEEGVYVISGSASEATIVVDAADTAKVQLVLEGVSITNSNFPAIYVKSADKVFVTLSGENKLAVTGEFTADGETDTDAVIFSKDDLCLNGTGSLTIESSEHSIVSKDDLKVTGGTYTITAAAGSGLRANDSVRIADGTFTITAEDGIKAKNDDDNELGYVYIQNGSFKITSTGNGIQGYAFVWIDGGTFDISGEECIEGTYVQINDGTVNISATDDGINAAIKSSVYTPTLEITGGELNISMASGDTDALDSNGYLYIKGGKITIEAQSAFDYSWGAEMTGGEVYVNGEQVTEITESMMGPGGGMGGPGGNMGGRPDGNMGGQAPQDGQAPQGMGSSQRPTPPDFNKGERPQRPGSSQ